jgi:hypothetical protein
MSGRSKRAVISSLDVFHGLPVVLLGSEGVGEDRNKNEWRQKSNDVPCQHRVVGTSGIDAKRATLLLGCHEPGNERADQAEWWCKSGGPPILLRPEERQACGEDGRGDNDTHKEVQITHGDTRIDISMPSMKYAKNKRTQYSEEQWRKRPSRERR